MPSGFLIPEQLETPRLFLRMFKEEDWKPLHAMLGDEECVRYTLKTPQQEWQTWRILAGHIGHWHLRGYGPYAAVDKATDHFIGIIGLWYPGDWPEPEIKWSLAREFWGKGYATEGGQAVRNMVSKHLGRTRLISLILPDNKSSKAVAMRLGGIYEKTISFRKEEADIFVYDLAA